MRIASIEEQRMDDQFQNLPIFGSKFWFIKLKKFVNLSIYEILKIY